jgi:hypothetical protein
LAPAPEGTFLGGAYGTAANAEAGPVQISLARSAGIGVSCNGTDGETVKRQANSLEAGPDGSVLTAGTARTTSFTDKTDTEAIVRTSARVDGLNMFNGLLTATSVQAMARAKADADSVGTSDLGSEFQNFMLNGEAVPRDVPPNTQKTLPGIGTVTLKKEITGGNGKRSGRLTVEMIVIDVDTTNPFLPIGAQITVGHAQAGFDRTEPGVETTPIACTAWATSANAKIGNLLQNEIGKAASIGIGCDGTDGKTLTRSADTIDARPVLKSGSGETSAFGDPSETHAVVKLTATVDSVRLLSGLITAASVEAVAKETFDGSVRTRSTEGSGLHTAKVLGVPLPGEVPPNTQIPVPGYGYVVLNEQIIPPDDSNKATQVNGIHVVITEDNPLHLPVGAEILVAHAQASAGEVDLGL